MDAKFFVTAPLAVFQTFWICIVSKCWISLESCLAKMNTFYTITYLKEFESIRAQYSVWERQKSSHSIGSPTDRRGLLLQAGRHKLLRGRGIHDRVMELHGQISTSPADTVDPAIHGAMTLEGRLVGDSSWFLLDSRRLKIQRKNHRRDIDWLGSSWITRRKVTFGCQLGPLTPTCYLKITWNPGKFGKHGINYAIDCT